MYVSTHCCGVVPCAKTLDPALQWVVNSVPAGPHMKGEPSWPRAHALAAAILQEVAKNPVERRKSSSVSWGCTGAQHCQRLADYPK